MRTGARRDLHCVVGPGLHAALAFSADVGQLDDALQHGRARNGQPAERRCRTGASGFSGRWRWRRRARDAAPSSRFPTVCRSRARWISIASTQQALRSEIEVHVVVYGRRRRSRRNGNGSLPQRSGSYRLAGDEDELQHAFWCVVLAASQRLRDQVRGFAEKKRSSAWKSESSAEHGETAFEPPRQTAGDRLPNAGVHVK